MKNNAEQREQLTSEEIEAILAIINKSTSENEVLSQIQALTQKTLNSVGNIATLNSQDALIQQLLEKQFFTVLKELFFFQEKIQWLITLIQNSDENTIKLFTSILTHGFNPYDHPDLISHLIKDKKIDLLRCVLEQSLFPPPPGFYSPYLITAIESSHSSLFKLLLTTKPDLTVRKNHTNAFEAAMKRLDWDVINDLLDEVDTQNIAYPNDKLNLGMVLVQAAHADKFDLAARCIKKYTDCGKYYAEKGSQDYTAAHFAITHKHYDFLQRMLQAGFDAYRIYGDGPSAFSFAIMQDDADALQCILDCENKTLRRPTEFTPYLHQAIISKRSKCIELLLQQDYDFSKKIDGDTLLLLVARSNDWSLLSRLLDIIPNSAVATRDYPSDPLQLGKVLLLTTQAQKFDLAKRCCKEFTDYTAHFPRQKKGFTAGHFAITFHQYPFLEQLLDAGFNGYRSYDGCPSAFEFAMEQDDDTAFEIFLNHSNKESTIQPDYTSYLHKAIRLKKKKITNLLLTKDCDFGKQIEKETLLTLVTKQKNWDLLGRLLTKVASLEESDLPQLGEVLLLTTKANRFDLAKQCIKGYTDLHCSIPTGDLQGYTAAHFAIVKKNYAFLNALLQAGFNPNRSYYNASSAINFALQLDDSKALECFLNHENSETKNTTEINTIYLYNAIVNNAIVKHCNRCITLLLGKDFDFTQLIFDKPLLPTIAGLGDWESLARLLDIFEQKLDYSPDTPHLGHTILSAIAVGQFGLAKRCIHKFTNFNVATNMGPDEQWGVAHWAIYYKKYDILQDLLEVGFDSHCNYAATSSAFSFAIMRNDYEALELLLADPHNAVATQQKITSYLHQAITNDSTECIELLMKKELDFNEKINQETLLSLVAKRQKWSLLSRLLDIFDQKNNCTADTPNLSAVLMLTAKAKQFDLAMRCIRKYTEYHCDHESKKTAAHFAIKYKNYALLDALLTGGFDAYRSYNQGLSAFSFTIEQDDDTALQCFLNHAHKQPETSLNLTPYLYQAIKGRHEKCVDLLLQNKCNFSETIGQDSVLSLAACEPTPLLLKRLLDIIDGEKKDYPNDTLLLGRTLLFAAENNFIDEAKRCIRQYTNLDYASSNGKTAAHFALKNHRLDLLSALLNAGFDGYKSYNGASSAFDLAIEQDDAEALNCFFECSNRENAISRDFTPYLHKAIKIKCKKVTDILLQKEIDFGKEIDQQTLLTLVAEREDWDLLARMLAIIGQDYPSDIPRLGKVLLLASNAKQFNLAHQCIKKYTNLNWHFSYGAFRGYTAAHLAIQLGNYDLLAALLNAGFDGYQSYLGAPSAFDLALRLDDVNALHCFFDYLNGLTTPPPDLTGSLTNQNRKSDELLFSELSKPRFIIHYLSVIADQAQKNAQYFFVLEFINKKITSLMQQKQNCANPASFNCRDDELLLLQLMLKFLIAQNDDRYKEFIHFLLDIPKISETAHLPIQTHNQNELYLTACRVGNKDAIKRLENIAHIKRLIPPEQKNGPNTSEPKPTPNSVLTSLSNTTTPKRFRFFDCFRFHHTSATKTDEVKSSLTLKMGSNP